MHAVRKRGEDAHLGVSEGTVSSDKQPHSTESDHKLSERTKARKMEIISPPPKTYLRGSFNFGIFLFQSSRHVQHGKDIIKQTRHCLSSGKTSMDGLISHNNKFAWLIGTFFKHHHCRVAEPVS